jgi:hypothetical protein
MKKIVLLLVSSSLLYLFFPGSSVYAGNVIIEGTSFPDEYKTGGRTLNIRGYALLRYLKIIKAYTGAFYLDRETASGNFADDAGKILVLHYFQNISGPDFAAATEEMLKKNVSSAEFSRLSSRLAAFNSLYRSVKPGDRYTVTYLPGQGMKLALNNETLGSVPGADFAAAFFSIWIGKKPIDADFRDRLLGRK